MSITGKTFEDFEERLEELYAKVNCLIADNKDVFLIKANIFSVNTRITACLTYLELLRAVKITICPIK